jgi:23S rRNA pseudouridine2457 synthase
MARYLAFYKPFEVLSQFTDSSGRQTLKDDIDVPGVYSAGRLDYRSEGLLLLSDDGGLIHRLTDPRYDHPKTYLAQVEGLLSEEAVSRLRSEIVLPGIQTKLPQVTAVTDPQLPPRGQPVRDYHPTSWLKIVLYEGKKHQVRRMTAATGFPTLRLVRITIGNIRLGDLQPGKWRDLTRKEIRELKSW